MQRQIGLIILFLGLVAALAACGGPRETLMPTDAPQGQMVTMDGHDPATGQTTEMITIFDRLPGGRRVGAVRSGAQVVLIRRAGDSALIRTLEGVQGYVAAAFIKELR